MPRASASSISTSMPLNAAVLVELYQGWYVVAITPALPLTQQQMDFTYSPLQKNLPSDVSSHPGD